MLLAGLSELLPIVDKLPSGVDPGSWNMTFPSLTATVLQPFAAAGTSLLGPGLPRLFCSQNLTRWQDLPPVSVYPAIKESDVQALSYQTRATRPRAAARECLREVEGSSSCRLPR